MTNELGLELDKQARYDVTKEEALNALRTLYDNPYKDDSFKAYNKLKQYIEERP